MKSLYLFVTLVVLGVCSCKQDCPSPLKSRVYTKVLDSTSKGAAILEHAPSVPYPDYSEIMIGMWTHGPFYKHRFILQFDLTAIPADAIVDSAFIEFNPANNAQSLNVSGGQFNNYSNNALFIERVMSAWDKTTVCWNSMPTVSADNYISVANVGTNNLGSGAIEITSYVKDWVAQPSENFGLFMLAQNETTNTYRRVLYGSNTHIESERRPVITIYYKSRGW